MTEQKFIWPVIVTGNCPEIILSLELLTETTRLHRRFTCYSVFLKIEWTVLYQKSIYFKVTFVCSRQKKIKKEKKKKKKVKPVTDSESSSETYHDGPAVVDHENVYAQNITCDAAFKFYKVGKASPSLEFTTIVRFKKDILLNELRSLLVKQHMVGIDLFKKFPAYDVHIHVHWKGKKYAAHTPQQWQEVRDLLARGFSLMGKKKAYYFDVCIDCLEMTSSYWYIKK